MYKYELAFSSGAWVAYFWYAFPDGKTKPCYDAFIRGATNQTREEIKLLANQKLEKLNSLLREKIILGGKGEK